MNLDEWIATEKATRARLAAGWLSEWQEAWRLSKIVKEAAAALAMRLAHLPQVTAVTGTLANGSEIVVTTSLPASAKLSDIPEAFATFPVVQVGVGDTKSQYLQRLRFVFQAAHIPEAERETWFRFFEENLRNVVTPYYCDTQEKWIAEAVVTAKAQGKLVGLPLVMAGHEVREAITELFKEDEPARLGSDPEAVPSLRVTLQRVFGNYGLNPQQV